MICFRQYQSASVWSEARNELPFDEKRGIFLYEKASQELKYNAEFLLEYGVRLAEVDSIGKAINILERSKRSFVSQLHLIELGYCYERLADYKLAEKYYLQAIHVSPSKLAPRYQLLLFYDKTGRDADAIKVAKAIETIVPKVSGDERAALIKDLAKKYLESMINIEK